MRQMELWSSLFPTMLWAALGLTGLVVGSFLNVIICRLPRMMMQAEEDDGPRLTLLQPASHCPDCGTPLRWRDLIPLISWLWLRGRCRHCNAEIAKRYPLIEVLSMVITLFAGALWPPGVELAGVLLFSWLLLALAAIDSATFLLPDGLNGLLLWSGLLCTLVCQPAVLPNAILGVCAGYTVLRLFAAAVSLMVGEACMGRGDAKLTAALGAWVGWQGLPLLLLMASLLGIVWAVCARWVLKRSLLAPQPFGPALAIGGWLLVICAKL